MTLARMVRIAIAMLGVLVAMQAVAGTRTVVRVTTDLGVLEIALLDDLTPLSVANFLAYVNAGDYDGTFIHRAARLTNGTPFVVQGGNFSFDGGGNLQSVTSRGAVVNEPRISNVRGTVAMAKLAGDPDSATNQWFVNMGDNSANLDNQNGGFTVFGTVLGDGMQVVDAIAALRIVNINSTFSSLPVDDDYVAGQPVTPNDLLYVQSAAVTGSPGSVSVPAVSGLSPDAAEQALVLAGLLVGATSGVVGGAPACVLSQSVVAGSPVTPGTMVDLVLTNPVTPAFTVPNVIGQTRDAAEAAIRDAGLTVGNVTGHAAAAVNGRVVKQGIAGGTEVPCGAAVDIGIATGAGMVPIILNLLLN